METTAAETNDASLVTLALQRIEPAFALLFKRHGRRLRSVIAARLSDPNDVPDVMQDTQLAVWRALPSYDLQRSFEAWLTSIAINKCRDCGRRRAVRQGTLSRFQIDLAHSAQWLWADHMESGVIEDERLGALRRAMTQLPSQLREPLIRTALLQHSQAVVARDLNVTVKAVETRIRRARQQLHSYLTAA